jgi:hypothetical protein
MTRFYEQVDSFAASALNNLYHESPNRGQPVNIMRPAATFVNYVSPLPRDIAVQRWPWPHS